MSDESPIDRPPELATILDPEDLESLVRSYAELHGVPLAVRSPEGAVLAQAGAAQELCGLIQGEANGNARCAAKLGEVWNAKLTGGARTLDCFTGFRYLLAPLDYSGTRLGSVTFGPYQPAERPRMLTGVVQSLLGGPGGAGLPAGERALPHVPQLSDEQARRAVDNVLHVLGCLVHACYSRFLVSELHMASAKEAYEDLLAKNRRLAEAVTRLTEADRLKSSFLATVSHELRTPLTSVIGYSEMLIEGLAGELGAEQRDYVKTIMEKGEQLLSLITGVLDVSRIASGSLELLREDVDMSEIVTVVATTVSGQARRKQITLQTRIGGELPRLHGDREKLRQVVLNLLSNAIKFTPEGGEIAVTLALASDAKASGALSPGASNEQEAQGQGGVREVVARTQALELSVRDTGIGISRDVQPRIFEPFFQVDSSSTREYGGTGLGLALVKNIIEAHGGTVWVESEFGRGSTFHVWIPLDLAAGRQAASGASRNDAGDADALVAADATQR